MDDKSKIKLFRKRLLKWFESNKRDFPWRKDFISDYELVITEILLQKTQASTVANYYHTFFNKYPNWSKIREAGLTDLEEILKPLGLYHHRAKRLLKISEEYIRNNCTLPKNSMQLKDSSISSLYLSAAYRLIILKKRAALLDVNMARVLSRFFSPQEPIDIRKDKIIQSLAQRIINIKKCKELNWGILDFAALICRSKNPKCKECILNLKCYFFNKE